MNVSVSKTNKVEERERRKKNKHSQNFEKH